MEDLLAGVRHERQFAGQYIDEFVFLLVPVALTRPGAGRQKSKIDTEVGESTGIAQRLLHAIACLFVKRRGIRRAFALSYDFDVDLGH